MTIEAQATLPAGWYTDPGQSGGKRWWDGVKWTEHLQRAVPTASATASKPMTATPYGIRGVVSAPRAPMSGEDGEAFDNKPAVSISNNTAWLALLFGVLAVGFSVLPSLPVSQTMWVGSAALIGLVCAVVGVARKVAGSSTNLWAPVIGVVLGIAATISVVTGVGVLSLVSAISPTASASPTALAVVPTISSEPLVFPANSELTTDEAAVQTLATSINRTFAGGGASLPSGDAWPTSVKMVGGTVVASNGAHLGKLPAGLTATYLLSSDNKSYHIAVAGQNAQEIATYNSAVNGFSWSCLADDTSCKPSN